MRTKHGRPTKPATPGERVSLGLKVRPEVKDKIDAVARKTGLTQSQQAEFLIENALSEAYGSPELHRFARLMVAAFTQAGAICARNAGRSTDPADWLGDEHSLKAGLDAVVRTVLAQLPDSAGDLGEYHEYRLLLARRHELYTFNSKKDEG
jgi:hypothetical protein